MYLRKTKEDEKLYWVDIPRVKGKMAECGYNITTFAQEIGVSRNTMSSYLANPKTIPYDKLATMAELLCDSKHEAAQIFFASDLR